ncbi:sigma factor-like helix-turn-helix DNA-binding protein [Streptomyces longispororuber]|uniref:sigma factor-like helix-turn-helix DNA-binding protein n=1 Tax=Streptomyces longispororuber TaxID=68230 RepID=UPI0021086A5C|nr:sigma factor-like helix-turn-helix DNA-binding protein [Streptomyces longispororuber]MCQ4209893.1 hypothetical protein [Streptomyces longispororuber]
MNVEQRCRAEEFSGTRTPAVVQPRIHSQAGSRRMLLRALDMSFLPVPSVEATSSQPDGVALGAERQAALTPTAAFDALYVFAAPGLIRETYVLTGTRPLAFESVEYAFRHAWQRWPEVARDMDPVGWVRAQAHDYALSPWHRIRRVFSGRTAMPDGVPWAPVLELPPWQRRVVVLCDGLGMSVSEAAAEMEASTGATRGRLARAHAALTECGTGCSVDEVRQSVADCVEDTSASTVAHPESVRECSERRVRIMVRTVYMAVSLLAALVAFFILAAP